jgi:hypothetical protein
MSPILGILASSQKTGLPVAGANLWLDAANATSFAFSSGSVVSSWTDRTTGLIFSQGTVANQPSRSGTQNGLPVVVWDGTNDQLVSTAAASQWTYLSNGSGSTTFSVVRSTQTAGRTFMATVSSLASSSIGYTQEFVAANGNFETSMYRGASGNVLINDSNAMTVNTFAIITAVQDPNNATTGNKLQVYKNQGAATNSTIVGTFATANTSAPSATLAFGGASGNPTTDPFKGDLAEIITYPSILGTTDRNLVITYLKAKWGL